MSVHPRTPPWIALGESPARSSQVFAATLDDVTFQTYDGLPTGSFPESQVRVAFTSGAGQVDAVRTLLARPEVVEARAELPEQPAERDALASTLRMSGWVVAELSPSSVGTWIADLRRPEQDEPVLPYVVRSGPAPAVATTWPATPAPEARQAEARPGVLAGLAGRRRALAVVALLAIAAFLALFIVAVVAGDLVGVVAVLVLGVLGLQTGTIVAVAYVVRHVRRTRVHRDEIDRRILRRIGVLENRLKSTRQQLKVQDQGTRQLVNGVSGAVQDLSVQQSRARVQAQEAAKRRHLSSTRQVQALGQLDRLVEITGPVPPMGGWAASPDLVVLVLEQLLERRPKVVVECGSGVTTLFTALAIEQHGLDCRIISLDHEEEFAGQTQRLLERHGVAHHVDLRCVPLEPTGLPGHDTPWYSRTALEGIDGVGLLVIDGPPEMTGEQARYPAMPLLQGRFAPDALVIMDDVIRAEDKRTAQRWAEENPAFSLAIRNDLEKYAGLLTRVV